MNLSPLVDSVNEVEQRAWTNEGLRRTVGMHSPQGAIRMRKEGPASLHEWVPIICAEHWMLLKGSLSHSSSPKRRTAAEALKHVHSKRALKSWLLSGELYCKTAIRFCQHLASWTVLTNLILWLIRVSQYLGIVWFLVLVPQRVIWLPLRVGISLQSWERKSMKCLQWPNSQILLSSHDAISVETKQRQQAWCEWM